MRRRIRFDELDVSHTVDEFIEQMGQGGARPTGIRRMAHAMEKDGSDIVMDSAFDHSNSTIQKVPSPPGAQMKIKFFSARVLICRGCGGV